MFGEVFVVPGQTHKVREDTEVRPVDLVVVVLVCLFFCLFFGGGITELRLLTRGRFATCRGVRSVGRGVKFASVEEAVGALTFVCRG